MERGTWRDGVRPLIRIASKLLALMFAGGGALGGMALADKLFPRNSTADTIFIIAGIVMGVLIWWPINNWLFRLIDPPTPAQTANRDPVHPT